MLRSLAFVLCCLLAGPLFAQKAHIDSLNNVLTETKVDTVKRDVHLQLAGIYKRNREYDKAYFHLQQYKSTNELISEKKSEVLLLAAEEKYKADEKALQADVQAKKNEYQEQVNYLIENEKSVAQDRSTLVIMLGSVGFILVISLVILIQVTRKRNLSKKALLDTRLDNAKLKEDAINAHLEYKSKQLTTRMLNIIQKNESMEDLKQKVIQINTELNDQQKAETEKLLEAVGHHIDIEKDWEEFYQYFEDVNSDFFANINKRFPELTQSQLRLCALVRLKLNINESANILRLEPNSVRVARTRLRQKMNLPPDMNLEDLMMEF